MYCVRLPSLCEAVRRDGWWSERLQIRQPDPEPQRREVRVGVPRVPSGGTHTARVVNPLLWLPTCLRRPPLPPLLLPMLSLRVFSALLAAPTPEALSVFPRLSPPAERVVPAERRRA